MTDLFDFKAPTRRYGLVGNPVSHSRSPLIHTQFGKQTGIEIEYALIQVDPGGFTQAIDNFRASGGEGLNITVPFKTEACHYADTVSDAVQLAQAANTLAFSDSGCAADNTDGVGLVADIQTNLSVPIAGKSILLVGAGGAARGAVGPLLAQQPGHLTIVNRTVDKAYALADQISQDQVSACGYEDLEGQSFDIVINATSASLSGQTPAVSESCVSNSELVYDMMYGSEPTVFLKWAHSAGARKTADGLGMLVEQAAQSFRIWTGESPQTKPVFDTLRALL